MTFGISSKNVLYSFPDSPKGNLTTRNWKLLFITSVFNAAFAVLSLAQESLPNYLTSKHLKAW